MRRQGRLTEWNDDRGFGFITPLDGGASVFAHVSQFPRAQRRPMATDLVTYELSHDDRGRPRAHRVEFLAPTRLRSEPVVHAVASGSAGSAVTATLVFFGLLLVMGFFTTVAWVVLAVDVALSAVTVLAYRADKLAAQHGRWRTEESALHLLSLLGGWPGALIAQQMYRHKTQKQSFRMVFWLTLAGNLGVLAWLMFAGILAAPLG